MRNRNELVNEIREHCVYAMFSMVDPVEPIKRAMDIDTFKEQARDYYLGRVGRDTPKQLQSNHFSLQVGCLVHAILETVKCDSVWTQERDEMAKKKGLT